MWNYEKRLQYPVNIKQTNPKIAQVIMSQYGGPDGELGASMRYISQRYTMPYREVAGILNDIGTEELAHLEMVSTIVHQLTRDLSPEELKASGFDKYYVDHTLGIWPQAAGGIPFNGRYGSRGCGLIRTTKIYANGGRYGKKKGDAFHGTWNFNTGSDRDHCKGYTTEH